MYLLERGLVRRHQVQEAAGVRRTRGTWWNSASRMTKAPALFGAWLPTSTEHRASSGARSLAQKTGVSDQSDSHPAGPHGWTHRASSPTSAHRTTNRLFKQTLKGHHPIFNIINQVVKHAMKKNRVGVKGMGSERGCHFGQSCQEASLKR